MHRSQNLAHALGAGFFVSEHSIDLGTAPGHEPQGTEDASMASLPKGVVALGLVSLFMDLSSEMIHSLLPVFLVTVLGASALSVGFIEGIAEATASITKVFSGVISDWMGR